MKAYLYFEQSNTFRDEFRKLGYEAKSYDIEGSPSVKIDLFKEIHKAYQGWNSVFDEPTPNDICMAFFPCTYFEGQNQLHFDGTAYQYKNLSDLEKVNISRERERCRSDFFQTICELVIVAYRKKIRLVIENPYGYNYLCKTLPIKPALIIQDRTELGDVMKKPTMFYFINFDPNLFVPKYEKKKPDKTISHMSQGIERSIISKEFARNFIQGYIIKD